MSMTFPSQLSDENLALAYTLIEVVGETLKQSAQLNFGHISGPYTLQNDECVFI